MKPFMETFVRSQRAQGIKWYERSNNSSKGNESAAEQLEEADEEIDDKAIEDNDFVSYQGNFGNAFAFSRQKRRGLVIREPSNRPWKQSSRSVVSDKGKEIMGPSKGLEDDS
ncbi:hypothetical protein GOBAR_AA10524 [Gossypium barbadense]|uniref:Uncharacterized protein n=1 Tax=Gossypium barbadense TaxID=3634 RepID=A0A2P5Y3J8_GOSBA|nr:hypothetical protein GOBAR_AA10524 [Gossypium barbadense]